MSAVTNPVKRCDRCDRLYEDKRKGDMYAVIKEDTYLDLCDSCYARLSDLMYNELKKEESKKQYVR